MSSKPNSTPKNVVIRDIETLAEMREVEELQREIWGVTDLDVFPALALRPLREVGAILIGAFTEGRMVGFVFGFPGVLNGEMIIHSDMLGISPDYRSRNLGYRLKCAQRDSALAQGVKRITWTFDPLQSRNAHLNFRKLGVIADRYYVNYYGETSSFLHRFGTDRLWVTWLLTSDGVRSRIERNAGPAIPLSELDELPALVQVDDNGAPVAGADRLHGQRVVVEIPGDLSASREDDTNLMQRWRAATRECFATALNAGYVVEDFYQTERANRKIGIYLLTGNA